MQTPKIILCGNTAVGKTTLMHSITGTEMKMHEGPTMGAGFSNTVLSHNGKPVSLNIWDTAGQETYRSIIRIYFRGSELALVVFDISSKSSFEEIPNWFSLIEENTQGRRSAAVIIANKCDLDLEREVSNQEIQEMADKFNVHWLLVSSLQKTNIDTLKEMIAEIIYTRASDSSYHTFSTEEETKHRKELEEIARLEKEKADQEKEAEKQAEDETEKEKVEEKPIGNNESQQKETIESTEGQTESEKIEIIPEKEPVVVQLDQKNEIKSKNKECNC